jgi:GIY-YIG catalytic domain
MLLRFFNIPILYCDTVKPWQLSFQESIYLSYNGILDLYDLIMFNSLLIYDFFYIPIHSNILFSLLPIIIYSNIETEKSIIYLGNKGKAGIYQWTHKESGEIYIGSAVDLTKRLKDYFSPAKLKEANNYISRAILHHTHSAFSLSILEYIDISNFI